MGALLGAGCASVAAAALTEGTDFNDYFYLDRLGTRTDHSVTAAEWVHDGGRKPGCERTGGAAGCVCAGLGGADAGGV